MLVSYILGIVTPLMDKILALSESVVTFYLGYPTAKALAKVLLQTTPSSIRNGVENRLREVNRVYKRSQGSELSVCNRFNGKNRILLLLAELIFGKQPMVNVLERLKYTLDQKQMSKQY